MELFVYFFNLGRVEESRGVDDEALTADVQACLKMLSCCCILYSGG